MPQDEHTRIIALDGFAHASRLREQANRLPRWRWWRRRRLLWRAGIVHEATARFWNDHRDDRP